MFSLGGTTVSPDSISNAYALLIALGNPEATKATLAELQKKANEALSAVRALQEVEGRIGVVKEKLKKDREEFEAEKSNAKGAHSAAMAEVERLRSELSQKLAAHSSAVASLSESIVRHERAVAEHTMKAAVLEGKQKEVEEREAKSKSLLERVERTKAELERRLALVKQAAA